MVGSINVWNIFNTWVMLQDNKSNDDKDNLGSKFVKWLKNLFKK